MKASTSLRTKYRGNVPPRFDTLKMVSFRILYLKDRDKEIAYVARSVM